MTDKLDIEAARRKLDNGNFPIGESEVRGICRKSLHELEAARKRIVELEEKLKGSLHYAKPVKGLPPEYDLDM